MIEDGLEEEGGAAGRSGPEGTPSGSSGRADSKSTPSTATAAWSAARRSARRSLSINFTKVKVWYC